MAADRPWSNLAGGTLAQFSSRSLWTGLLKNSFTSNLLGTPRPRSLSGVLGRCAYAKSEGSDITSSAEAAQVPLTTVFGKSLAVRKPGANFASVRRRTPGFPELTARHLPRDGRGRPNLGRQDKRAGGRWAYLIDAIWVFGIGDWRPDGASA